MIYSKIYQRYINERVSNLFHKFSKNDVDSLDMAVSNLHINVNDNLNILRMDVNNDYIEHNECHNFAVELWNDMFPDNFKISSIAEIKAVSSEFIKYTDSIKPFGEDFSEQDMILYVTAQSSSSFIGIQRPKKSQFAMNAMRSTLNSHSNPDLFDRPWLLENLNFLKSHIKHNPHLMDRNYADICMTARSSSSSIKGMGSFRDVVLNTSFASMKNDILSGRIQIPYYIVAGSRSDRRGKFRLICALNAYFRVLDYLINNGSYGLCEGNGLLSQYTTEGYNNEMMWPQLVRMSDRTLNSTMVCIDYKGYDTQISLSDYSNISKLINEYRLVNNSMSDIIEWYLDWLDQPKCLMDTSGVNNEVIIPYYRTLASGLHGTHSFENLIGISTMIEAKKRGVNFRGFWSNGDDQNALVNRMHLDLYIDFLESSFNISWDKSLIDHKLAVWGKLWFSKEFHPAWEIGTFMSIWQREGGESSFVEPSKFQSNFCKIVQVAITLLRMGKNESEVKSWINKLSAVCAVDPNRIPIKLNNLTSSSSSSKINDIPIGLSEAKKDLMSRTFKLSSLSVNNYYDMLLSMYQNRTYFDMGIDDVEYHSSGTTLYIKRSVNYSHIVPYDVPYVFRNIYTGRSYSLEDQFVRDVLQSTKSYDGPSSESYSFYDIYTLAVSVNRRNKSLWHKMTR